MVVVRLKKATYQSYILSDVLTFIAPSDGGGIYLVSFGQYFGTQLLFYVNWSFINLRSWLCGISFPWSVELWGNLNNCSDPFMAGRLSFVCLEWHGLPGRRGRAFCCRPAKVMVVRSYTSKIPMITGNIMVGSRFWEGFRVRRGISQLSLVQ